jgi:hypothetical protein
VAEDLVAEAFATADAGLDNALVAAVMIRFRAHGSAGALAVGLAVGLGAVGTTVGVADGSPSAAAPAAHAVHVNPDAWSVNTAANGKVLLTVRQLADKAGLEKALAAAGIPAVIVFDGTCVDAGVASVASASEIGNLLGIHGVLKARDAAQTARAAMISTRCRRTAG